MEEDRITMLERRLASAAARIADLETFRRMMLPQGPAPFPAPWEPGQKYPCACPPGAEFGCNNTGCPRQGRGSKPFTWGTGS